MARIFHGEYYLIDPNDKWDKEDLIREFENKFDISPDIHFIKESKEFEWHDDLPINAIGCPIEELKKCFEG